MILEVMAGSAAGGPATTTVEGAVTGQVRAGLLAGFF